MSEQLEFRSGFIAVIGRPNVGKSTLVNHLVGEKVAIVSPKPQTTRNRIVGVWTEDSFQAVFVDTPGIHQPRTRLGEFMAQSVREALQGTDIILLMADAASVSDADHRVLDDISAQKIPKILLLNKIDLVRPQNLLELIASFDGKGLEEIIPVSCKTGDGIEEVRRELIRRLPPGPRYFPQDLWTDQTERQLCAELIREKALLNLKEEIPHGIGVEVLSMRKLSERLTEIHADLYCEREGHKKIIIGKGGSMLEAIGSQARADIERLLGAHVNLKLWVKVRPGWRNSAADLKSLGYSQ